jgi:prephenate dehydrogenase
LTVGLIGYGRFGRLAAQVLARHATVTVYDPNLPATEQFPRGVRQGTLREAASQQVILLAVPVSALKSLLQRIARWVPPDALVADVCAVKRLPVMWMRRWLPKTTTIIGTHPFFGPDTYRRMEKGKRSLELHVALCPVRISPAQVATLTRLLRRERIVARIMTPADHDRLVAETIFLSQYVGRMVDLGRLRLHASVNRNYDALLRLVDVARRDSWLLFEDMWRYNSACKTVARQLQRGEAAMQKRLGRSPRR